MSYIDERAEEEGLLRKTILKEALQVLALEHLSCWELQERCAGRWINNLGESYEAVFHY